MGKENKDCPSYQDGICETNPAPYSVKCKDLNCTWQDTEVFKKTEQELLHGHKENKYCQLQDDCKMLKNTVNQYNAVVQQNKDLQSELQPFRHEFFKGLSTHVIAEIAKKSFRLTTYQINAETLFDYIENVIQNASSENAVRIIKKSIEDFRKRGE